jgi:8-oxo-dGTP diphosphatase
VKDLATIKQIDLQAEPIEAVGAVVYRRTRRKQPDILLIKKQGGFWTLPKGHIEPNEDQHMAVLREVLEETSIQIEVEQLICSTSYHIIKRNQQHLKQVTYYLTRAKKGRAQPSKKEKIERVKWFPLDRALRRIKRTRVKAVVRRASMLLGVALDAEEISAVAEQEKSRQ